MDTMSIVSEISNNLKEAISKGMTPAFVFDRISDKPDESKSLEYQDHHSARYANDKDLFVVKTFSVTESGWSSEHRKIFHLMLDLSER